MSRLFLLLAFSLTLLTGSVRAAVPEGDDVSRGDAQEHVAEQVLSTQAIVPQPVVPVPAPPRPNYQSLQHTNRYDGGGLGVFTTHDLLGPGLVRRLADAPAPPATGAARASVLQVYRC